MYTICTTAVMFQKIDLVKQKIATRVEIIFTVWSHFPTIEEVENVINKDAIGKVASQYPEWGNFQAQTHVIPQDMLELWRKSYDG